MPDIQIIPAILSGGAGTRLWPASTEARPKQFHAFGAARTLIQETLLRVKGGGDGIAFAAPIILCNAQHAALAAEQCAAIGVSPAAFVLEPIGRNTAATAVLAAALAKEIAPGARVLLLPADHIVAKPDAFRAIIAKAAPIAENRIVTLGIPPTRAEIGYGYIKAGAELAPGVHAIDAFEEKPDAQTAETYWRSGVYAWNAGMFLFDPDLLLEEFSSAPDIRDAALAALAAARRDGAMIAPPADLFATIRAAPFDKAVMEKTAKGAVAPAEIGWADIGSWAEIWRLAQKDAAGNAALGELVALDAANNLIRAEGKCVAIAGLSDLIVIAEGDTILILPRDRAQDVKLLCEKAKGGA